MIAILYIFGLLTPELDLGIGFLVACKTQFSAVLRPASRYISVRSRITPFGSPFSPCSMMPCSGSGVPDVIFASLSPALLPTPLCPPARHKATGLSAAALAATVTAGGHWATLASLPRHRGRSKGTRPHRLVRGCWPARHSGRVAVPPQYDRPTSKLAVGLHCWQMRPDDLAGLDHVVNRPVERGEGEGHGARRRGQGLDGDRVAGRPIATATSALRIV